MDKPGDSLETAARNAMRLHLGNSRERLRRAAAGADPSRPAAKS